MWLDACWMAPTAVVIPSVSLFCKATRRPFSAANTLPGARESSGFRLSKMVCAVCVAANDPPDGSSTLSVADTVDRRTTPLAAVGSAP